MKKIAILLLGITFFLANPNNVVSQIVSESRIKEAFERKTWDIRVSQILITVAENATDTIVAWRTISELRKRAVAGESFDSLAYKYSQDPSAKIKMGDLGFFTVFQMVYPFETAAYNTPVGNISEVVRTKFGYHLIKVTEKRKNQGQIKVAQIMVLVPKDSDEAKQKEAEIKIKDLYKKIKAGENFENIAKDNSEDKGSAKNGGELAWFGTGRMVPEFESASFALKNIGDISEPIKTSFGWHIIKLIDKKPVGNYEDEKASLTESILKSEGVDKTKDDNTIVNKSVTSSLVNDKGVNVTYTFKDSKYIIIQSNQAVTVFTSFNGDYEVCKPSYNDPKSYYEIDLTTDVSTETNSLWISVFNNDWFFMGRRGDCVRTGKKDESWSYGHLMSYTPICFYKINQIGKTITLPSDVVEKRLFTKANKGNLADQIKYLKTNLSNSDDRNTIETKMLKYKNIENLEYILTELPYLSVEVKSLLEEKYFDKATKGVVSDCDIYLAKFSNNIRAKEIIEIKAVKVAENGTIKDCDTYLTKYPTGKFVNDVKTYKSEKQKQIAYDNKVKTNSNKLLWKLGNKICCEQNGGIICGSLNQWNEDKSMAQIKIITSPSGTYEGEPLNQGNMIWITATGKGWHLCLDEEITRSSNNNQAGSVSMNGNSSGGGASVGKNCYWYEELTIDNSDGSFFGALTSGLTAIKYNVKYTGVVETELGSNYKIIISNAGVELGSYASMNQIKYKSSANEYVQKSIGKTVVKDKASVKF